MKNSNVHYFFETNTHCFLVKLPILGITNQLITFTAKSLNNPPQIRPKLNQSCSLISTRFCIEQISGMVCLFVIGYE